MQSIISLVMFDLHNVLDLACYLLALSKYIISSLLSTEILLLLLLLLLEVRLLLLGPTTSAENVLVDYSTNA